MRSHLVVSASLILCMLGPRTFLRAADDAAPAAAVAPDKAVIEPGGDARAVTDPVYVTWNHACVVYRHFADQGKWEGWTGPPAALPIAAVPVVGPHAAAALDPQGGGGGWLFDFHARAWTKIPQSPIAPPQGMPGAGIAAFVGRDLVVWGAMGGDVEGAALDTATLKWRPIAKAPVAPRYRAVRAVIGSNLIVWGGYGPLGPRRIGPQDDGAAYDVATDKWEKLPRAPVPGHRYGCSAVTSKGRFIVFGGTIDGADAADGMAFDTATRKWEVVPPAPVPVGAHAACAADDDRLFVWSGGPQGGGHARPDGAIYDFWTRKWTKLPDAPIPPRLVAFARIDARCATIWGGWDPHTEACQTDGATFDFKTRTWQKLPPMPREVPHEMHPGW